MARTREKAHGRRDDGSYVALPHRVLNCSNFLALSAHAVKLLIDLCSQYKGRNNGDLAAPWSAMRERGWKSRETLWKAISELECYGMIERTRHGGEGKSGRKPATLYALTWQAIDECDGKLDVRPAPSSGKWREPAVLELLYVPKKSRRPTRPASRVNTPTVSKVPKPIAIDTPGVSIGVIP